MVRYNGGVTFNLTKREKDVLQLIISGLSDKEIGITLGISYGTVRDYVDKIQLKLGAGNRAHLAVIGIRANIV